MEYRKLSDLQKLEGNPRKIKKEDMERLVSSIQKFGVIEGRPFLLSNRTGELVIIGGNMRYEACKKLKIKEVPTHLIENLTEEEEREIIIRDNVNNDDWDMDMLATEWSNDPLEEWGVDVSFETVEPKVEEDNFVPDMNIQTDIVLGDLFTFEKDGKELHRLLCGDSTHIDEISKLMNGELADLAHNDPPYGMKKEKDGVLNDNLNFDDLLEFNRDWISLQFSFLKSNGSWYCWGIDEPLMDIYSHILKPYAKDQKVTFRNLITWDKNGGQGQNSDLMRMFPVGDEKCLFVMLGKQDLVQNKDQFPEEWRPLLTYLIEERDKMKWKSKDCVRITGTTSATHYFTESQFQIPTAESYNKLQEAAEGKAFLRDFNEMSKEGNSIMEEFRKNRAYFDNTHDNMTNVWKFERTTGAEKDSAEGHATPKPLALCGRAIKSSCPEGGLTIDFFLGSGSTMVSAHQLKRKCYGMEMEPKYCQTIINRMKMLDPSLVIKRNGEEYQR